ncbi:uncharacterized protein PHACADRAFT_47075, partial [Phanerochaete carnosa HHB-10118-sp]
SLAFSPDNHSLISGFEDETAIIWDAQTGACLHSFDIEGNIDQVAFSPNGSHIYINANNSCSIYETQNYRCISELRHHDKEYCELSVSRQGDRIATASMDDQVKIWSAVTGEELLTIDHPGKLSYSVTFSPDGSEVLAACD